MRLLLLLASCFVATAHAAQGNLLPGWARGGLLHTLLSGDTDSAPSSRCKEYTLTVPLDHFNASDARTMPVRYWTDASCQKPGTLGASTGDGPIFVEMGGEAGAGCHSCGERERPFGALAVQVEHRMYGESLPIGDLSVENLPFLTTPQNLADTAAVIKALNPKGDRRVMTFGGSYR